MQTQKDHVHAYQTLVGRMSAALLLGDPNQSEPPARRAFIGIVFGMVLALLIGVAFWVYGLINPGGNTAWSKPKAIVVEEESGARYVYQNGALVPVLNHASAMLVQGAGAKVENISRASLVDVPRGRPMGIEGAPQSVPEQGSLVSGGWLLCLGQGDGGPVPGGGSLSMNLDPDVASTPVTGKEYLWVTSTDGTQYVVWGNQKMRLAEPSVPIALGLGVGVPPTAAPEWLGALPDGPEIAAASLPGGDEISIAGAVHQPGTVFRQDIGNGVEHYFVLREDGLAPLSATEAALLQSRSGAAAVPIDAVSIAGAPRSADSSLTTRIPDLLTMRPVPAGERALCLKQQPQGVFLASQPVTADPGVAGIGAGGQTGRMGMHLKPGTALLAASVPAPTGRGQKPDRYLIDETGMKYRLADDEAIKALGFGGAQPNPVPAELLAAIPSGPMLSREAVGVFEKGQG
ncbi:type VII secretion protein EccB [Amycolatopsis antarctica]|uniref:Type VII secretion protein EccB n=1 Tax=Amycolatopsis antarctica TaxID=1854586 RepID=A0A263CZJ7_9PSEU|nr:type VII secretion protein EccB [Amycolatopsis antarctica]OZM70827.1 type VII secretion protein EccB [Amycolatopsis antarctica]